VIQPALLHATKTLTHDLSEGIDHLTADQQADAERWAVTHTGPFGVFWHLALDGPTSGLTVVIECWTCIDWWPHTPA
jgi:hypothetical protein